MDDSRGGCPGGPAAPPHSRPSPGDPWAVQGRAGDWRGVRAAAQPWAAVLPLLSKHRPGEASPMWEGKRRIRVRIHVDQNTGEGVQGFHWTLGRSRGRECRMPPGEVGSQFKRVRHPLRSECDALPAQNVPDPAGAGGTRLPQPAKPGSLALRAYLICTSVMMWLELNYGALM